QETHKPQRPRSLQLDFCFVQSLRDSCCWGEETIFRTTSRSVTSNGRTAVGARELDQHGGGGGSRGIHGTQLKLFLNTQQFFLQDQLIPCAGSGANFSEAMAIVEHAFLKR
ncbi:unnamed protein product, partial [Gulo gulo]